MMTDISFSLLEIQERVCFVRNSGQFTWQGHRKLQWTIFIVSKDAAFKQKSVSSRQLTRVVTTHAYLATKWKDKKKTGKERKINGVEVHTRARRYKITSTLRLLLRGDPQDEGLRRLQPCARWSRLDYFYAVTLAPWGCASEHADQSGQQRLHVDSATFDNLLAHQLCFNHEQVQPYCRFCIIQWPQLFQILLRVLQLRQK